MIPKLSDDPQEEFVVILGRAIFSARVCVAALGDLMDQLTCFEGVEGMFHVKHPRGFSRTWIRRAQAGSNP